MIELIRSNKDKNKNKEVTVSMIVCTIYNTPFLHIQRDYADPSISNEHIYHPINAIHFRLLNLRMSDSPTTTDIIEMWETGESNDLTDAYEYPHDRFLSMLDGVIKK